MNASQHNNSGYGGQSLSTGVAQRSACDVQSDHPGQPPAPGANPSCFGNLEDVRGTAEAAVHRVERAVARLVGHLTDTTDATIGLQSGRPPHLFDAADQDARDIRGFCDRIFAAVDRLEKNLP